MVAVVACGQRGPRDFELTLQHGGMERTAWVHLPLQVDGSGLLPVIFNFHGYQTSGRSQQRRSGLNAAAETRGFVTVHPEGAHRAWNGGSCCGRAQAENVDDVGFVGELLRQLAARVDVDPQRVFAMGLSNGAFLAYRLGCERPETFAAVMVVAGLNVTAGCFPGRPVPLLHLHGADDPVVPYNGRDSMGFMRVRDSVEHWPGRGGCTAGWERAPPQGDTTCETLATCSGGAVATLCTIAGGGHNWPGEPPQPGLGHVSHDISATGMALDFFEAHARR